MQLTWLVPVYQRMFIALLRFCVASLCCLSFASVAAQPRFQLTIHHHLFSPSTLYVPAGEKIKIEISNQDPSPEEFESFSLNREKVILGQSKGVVFVGPLEPGQYPFSGEYNPNSARGVLIALPKAEWQQYCRKTGAAC